MSNNHDLTDDSRFNFSPDELLRLEHRWKSDVDLKLDALGQRTSIIERLVWIAVGGIIVIAGIAAFGISIVVKQGDKIDAVALRQASSIAERQAHVEALKADIRRIQEEKKR